MWERTICKMCMERQKEISLFRDFYVDGVIMHFLINLIVLAHYRAQWRAIMKLPIP
jgi:hypothetical protein